MHNKNTVYQIPTGAIVVILSAPSGGKNTFANTLVGEDPDASPILHIDTGDLIRKHNNPEHFESASRGRLIDDYEAFEIIQGYYGKNYHSHRHQVVFVNGFPRSVKQVGMVGDIHHTQTKILLHLKVCDRIATKRFEIGLEDPDRKNRNDNKLRVFEDRLKDYRRREPLVLREAKLSGFTILKCRIDRCSHTRDVAQDFQRRHMKRFFGACV